MTQSILKLLFIFSLARLWVQGFHIPPCYQGFHDTRFVDVYFGDLRVFCFVCFCGMSRQQWRDLKDSSVCHVALECQCKNKFFTVL